MSTLNAFRKRIKSNPFFSGFVWVSLICSLFLGILLLVVTAKRETAVQKYYRNEKADIILKDFELQMSVLEDLALTFSVNEKYHTSTLAELKYNEKVLLMDFANHVYSSTLTEDIFLRYPNNKNIFHVTGYTVNPDVYFRALSSEERAQMDEILAHPGQEQEFLMLGKFLYILTPFKAGKGLNAPRAYLGAAIKSEELSRRIQTVGGNIAGTIQLYADDQLLYTFGNSETEKDLRNNEDAFVVFAANDDLSLCYLADTQIYSPDYLLKLLLLFFMDILLLILIARLFAVRAYKPLLQFREKYKKSADLSEEKEYGNIFEELEGIMDSVLQHNILSSQQILKVQGLLKQQILRQILNGDISADVQNTLYEMGICLPGPFYYAVCTTFIHKAVERDFLLMLSDELEKMYTDEDNIHLYVVVNETKKQLGIICSIRERNQEKEITEEIEELAESYSYKPLVGVGKVYHSLDKVSASWLESLANQRDSAEKWKNSEFQYNSNLLQGLEDALLLGDEENALQELEQYIKMQREQVDSLLMQQYLFAEFVGSIGRLARMNQIELSNQGLSLLVTSKDMDSFHEAAQEVIAEYCDKFRKRIHIRKIEDAQHICAYIKNHFTEYDISIEKVAEKTETSTTAVREAVLTITGKLYKDYVVWLRMEYAKKLMREQDLPVAEVCEQVGYSSVSYFIRLFRETTGDTPAKFMKTRR